MIYTQDSRSNNLQAHISAFAYIHYLNPFMNHIFEISREEIRETRIMWREHLFRVTDGIIFLTDVDTSFERFNHQNYSELDNDMISEIILRCY